MMTFTNSRRVLFNRAMVVFLTLLFATISAAALAKPLTILSPSTGDELVLGQTFNVRWAGGDPAAIVQINLVDVATNTTLSDGMLSNEPNDGQAAFTIPSTLQEGQYKIYIEAILNGTKKGKYSGTFHVSTPSNPGVSCSVDVTASGPVNGIQFYVDFETRSCVQGGYPGQGNGILYSLSSGNTSGNPDVTKVRFTSYMCGYVNSKRHGREASLVPASGDKNGVNKPYTLWGGVTYFGAIPGPTAGANSAQLTVTSTVKNTDNSGDPVTYIFTVEDINKPLGQHQFTYGAIKISGGRFDDPAFPAPVCSKGMTWLKYANDPTPGIVDVGCGGGAERCNPYQGDTFCAQKRPLLCFLDTNAAEPMALQQGKPNRHKWSGGSVAATPIVRGLDFKTISEANTYCAKEFGAGWRVADFHDGQGWYMTAYGDSNTLPDRFWVNIKNQSKGNCWAP